MVERTWSTSILRSLIGRTTKTYEEIAHDAGIGRSTLNKILNHNYPPSADILIALADYFAVPIDLLCGRLPEDRANDILEHYPETFKMFQRNAYEQSMFNRRIGNSKDIPKGYEAPWPYNLLNDIFERMFVEVITPDQEAGLEAAIGKLKPKTADILIAIYRDHKKLDEAGTMYNVGRERARQIKAKGVRQLRSPAMKALIADGLEGSKQLEEELFYISEKRQVLLIKANQLKHMEELYENKEAFEHALVYTLPFEEVIDNNCKMTVRTFNCLKRSGAKTVDDILKKFEDGTILKIRNFGRKSYEELVDLLEAAGFDVPELPGEVV